MCTVLISYKQHPEYKLILATNRDEFYDRPTEKAHWWEKHTILGGKDLKAGGSWLCINPRGRMACITNYRDLSLEKKDAVSRGNLVKDFVLGETAAEEYFSSLKAADYSGFNMIAGTLEELSVYSNIDQTIKKVPIGISGLSNHLFNTPWPKVEFGRKELERIISKSFTTDELFQLLLNENKWPDKELPNTGIPIEWERMLSSLFIKSPNYGTRCSTVLLIDNNDKVTFKELSHKDQHITDFSFTIDKA